MGAMAEDESELLPEGRGGVVGGRLLWCEPVSGDTNAHAIVGDEPGDEGACRLEVEGKEFLGRGAPMMHLLLEVSEGGKGGASPP